MYKPDYVITDKILTRISQIEELRTKARAYKILPEREAFIHKRATLESTHSSTSIEGNPLNMKQVEKVLYSNKLLAKEQYAEIEVKNYKRSLDWISKRKREKKLLCFKDILDLHGIITDSLLDKTRSGKIRQYPVYIDQDGKNVYDGPDAERVESELDALFAWVEKSEGVVHPIIVAGVLHYMLASIHPFADGNGRTARAAVSLYLALKEYDFRESLVLDSYYAVDKKAYYDVLKSVQNRFYDNAKVADITSWLDYFTEGFLSSAELLTIELQALSVVQDKVMPLKHLTRDESDIISYVVEFGSINLSETLEILVNVSRRTAQRKLSKLVEDGYLRRDGEGPAARYVIGG